MASASGFTPFSQRRTQTASVSASSPVFSSLEVSSKTENCRDAHTSTHINMKIFKNIPDKLFSGNMSKAMSKAT